MVVHVNDVSLTDRAVIASVGLKGFKDTFETLVLIFGEVWLPAV
jgi:hypothetical protein